MSTGLPSEEAEEEEEELRGCSGCASEPLKGNGRMRVLDKNRKCERPSCGVVVMLVVVVVEVAEVEAEIAEAKREEEVGVKAPETADALSGDRPE